MRLIDADALKADLLESKEKLWEIYNGLSHHADKQICAGEIATFQETILRINKAPTIEAEPVKRGRWERVPSNGIGGTARCSICGKAIYGYHTMNYCPNCGAKMDGGDNDA